MSVEREKNGADERSQDMIQRDLKRTDLQNSWWLGSSSYILAPQFYEAFSVYLINFLFLFKIAEQQPNTLKTPVSDR